MEVEKAMMGNLSDDLVIEIFDRIPIKQLTRMKCLSKGWRHSISQYRRSRPRSSNSDLVIHYNSTDVDNDNQVLFYNRIEKVIDQNTKIVVLETLENDSLSFSIDTSIQFIGSSNGILLCKKFIENADDEIGNSYVYVSNPILNQWVSLPLAYISKRLSNCMALSFDVVNQHHFKVVICDVDHLELYKGCRFLSRCVYSSDIGLWDEKSHKAIIFNSYILSNNWRSSSDNSYFYRKGIAHWQFSGIMLIYHFEMDFFKVFNLPSVNGGCLWESEGYLHYCHKNISGFSIWRFVEDEVFDTQFEDQDAMQKWQLKHTIEFCLLEPQLLEIVGPDSFEPLTNIIFKVLGFDEDLQILYLAIPDIVLSYSFESRRLKKVSTYATGEISCSQYILWQNRVSFMMQPSGVTLPLGCDPNCHFVGDPNSRCRSTISLALSL